MTNDILDLSGRISSLKKGRKGGPLAMQNYGQVNQAIRRKMKQAKDNWITHWLMSRNWLWNQNSDKITDFEVRQYTTLSELQNDQPDLSLWQGHAMSDPRQASKPGRTDIGRGPSRFQITRAYRGTDIQLEAIGGKASGSSETDLS